MSHPAPLAGALAGVKGVRVQLLNALRSFRDVLALQRLGQLGVHFDIAMLEGIEGVRHHLDRAPGARLTFGSHAPFFSWESAALKLEESLLSADERVAILSGNATRLG